MTRQEKKLIQAIEYAIERHYGNKMFRNQLEEKIDDIKDNGSNQTAEEFEAWLESCMDENY